MNLFRSLRFRLAAISTAISGLAILTLLFFLWQVIVRSMEAEADLEMSARFGRILDQAHPRMKVPAFRRDLRTTLGDDPSVLLHVYNGMEDEILFETEVGGSDWMEEIPLRLPKTFFTTPTGGPRHPITPHEPRLDPAPERREPPKRPRIPREALEGATTYADWEWANKPWRVVHMYRRGFHLMAAVERGPLLHQLQRIRLFLLLSVPVSFALIAGVAWFVADRALRPIRVISETASQITAQGLDHRLQASGHSDPEISSLTQVLNAMMERLERSFHAANRFSADVSHELQTPISILQMQARQLEESLSADPESADTVAIMRSEVQRLKQITQSLMLLSKADTGTLAKNFQEVDLSAEFQTVAEDFAILADAAGIELRSEADESLTVLGDTTLLRQAIANLFSNAVKYNHQDGFIEARLTKTTSGDDTCLTIRNTGEAIPADDQPLLFERFHRVDKSRSRNIDGFGLGLSLTQEIVMAHGGSVELVASDDESTCFAMMLPLAQE